MFFKKKPRRHVVIIGNGIAGVSCARALRARDKKCRITLVSGESPHFFSRPALMYIYMGHMQFENTKPYEDWWWAKQRIDLRQAWVTHIDTSKNWLTFAGNAGGLSYDQLVLATGSQPNKWGWPGQDLERVSGLYTLQDLQYLESISDEIQHGVIVGGGLIGIELAEMLHSRGKHVSILAREETYWSNALPLEESQMVTRVINAAGIDLRCGAELAEIVDDGAGKACAVKTKAGEQIDCQYVGLTAGVRPNLSALQGSDIPTGRGVLVDRSFRTQVEDVFAIGDCAEIVAPEGQRNTLEQLWYTGEMHGNVLAAVLCGEDQTYDRGIWFNSAKFIDLEWHTYGEVPPAGRPVRDSVKQLYWEAGDGLHSFRLIFENEALIGVNAMGIRYRHKICEKWIADGLSLDAVLNDLPAGNFDPEFYRKYEREIAAQFRSQAAQIKEAA